ncbi:MAG: hypothetical protein KDD62_00010 [Bdellovibrionales bacterium]|nr:hypothetical protein [Bdellovibrionales bacterium]
MPKDWFKLENLTPLASIPKGGKIHFIGVCGVAMGQLAVALSERGYQVSGSDKEFYEPMGSFLSSSKIELCRGYDANNIPAGVDLIVIGNAISYGHPEVERIEQENLPYTCFPRALQETVIAGKHSIVASGTHGKSTTTAMIASSLLKLDKDPSYFVGGVSPELRTSLNAGSGTMSVVEGDEYDDVFFSKKAKFVHYAPNTAVINAIEFDHADLYPNLDAIVSAFEALVRLLPDDGVGICCIDFPVVKELTSRWSSLTKARCLTFGQSAEADFRICNWSQNGARQSFTVENTEEGTWKYDLPLVGEYNARNALACTLACREVGCSPEAVITTLSSYKSVKRRQQVHVANDQIVLIEDFAHHPTAVAETVAAVKKAYPDRPLCAVFEPRSNTSRRKVFEQQYIAAFGAADRVILANVQARAIDSGHDLLNVEELAATMTTAGKPTTAIESADAIFEEIVAHTKGQVVLVMSNGSFGGLPQKLIEHFT